MQFQLFKNEDKTKENQPDYRISAKNEFGRFEEIGAGWIKQMKNGKKYISCSLKEKKELTPEEKEHLERLRQKETSIEEDFNTL